MNNVVVVPKTTSTSVVMVPVKPPGIDVVTTQERVVFVPLTSKNTFGIMRVGDGLEVKDGVVSVQKTTPDSQSYSIKNVLFDQKTGVFTFTKQDDSKIIIDTHLERVVTNFIYDEDSRSLVLSLEDGTKQTIPMAAFIDDYIGVDGVEIQISVSNNNEIEAILKNGVVSELKLTDDVINKLNDTPTKLSQLIDDVALSDKASLSDLEKAELRTTLNSLNFQPKEGALLYHDNKLYIQGEFVYTTKANETVAVGVDGTIVLSAFGEKGVDVKTDNTSLIITTNNTVVDVDTIQNISGVKTFLTQIGIKNVNGDVDYIKHINNNFLISGANGDSLLNIDSGLQKIYSFNRELAFVDDIPGSSGGISQEVDPTVPAWAKEPEKPTYKYSEILEKPTDLATETFVKNEIANAQLGGEGGDIDLSGYATKDELNLKADKTQLADYVTNEALNNKGYLTSVPSEYKTKAENDTLYQEKGSYITAEDDPTVPSFVKSITQEDITGWNNKANMSDIPTDNKQLINGAGYLTEVPVEYKTKSENDALYQEKGNYLTEVPSEYVTETELSNKNYATTASVASAVEKKADKTEIPTNNNQLSNGAGYITSNDLLNLIYPVGSIYMSINDVSPQVFLGGTWQRWAEGRMPLGVGSNGESTHANSGVSGGSASSVATHTHEFSVSVAEETEIAAGKFIIQPKNTGTQIVSGGTGFVSIDVDGGGSASGSIRTDSTTVKEDVVTLDHSHALNISASGTTANANTGVTFGNLPPYTTCYMWKRIG